MEVFSMKQHLVHAMISPVRKILRASCWATVFLLVVAGAAVAGSEFSVKPVANPEIECTCRANGANYRLGDQVCLSTATGPRLAVCEMAQNMTNWGVTKNLCPTASRLEKKKLAA